MSEFFWIGGKIWLLDGWVFVCKFRGRWSVDDEGDDGGEVQGDLEGFVVFWAKVGVRP